MTAESRLATLTAGVLRLEFVRRANRIEHRLLRPGSDTAQPTDGQVIAVSEEGFGNTREGNAQDGSVQDGHVEMSDAHWPPSPPFQQLHVEDHGAGEIAMLVGMAGTSHWSAAVTCTPRGFEFDVACRIASSKGNTGRAERTRLWLGSTYQLLGGMPQVANCGSALTIRHADLVFVPRQETALELNSSPGVPPHEPSHMLRLLPMTNAQPGSGVTVRWRYLVGQALDG